MPDILRRLQDTLERVYEVRAPHSVADFLLTDRKTLCAIEGAGRRASEEKLLMAQSGDTLEMSLWLDPLMLRRLRCDDPFRKLHAGNLRDFLVVIEGVSHFVYAAWRAMHDRALSLLELEMQGEVDKFVLAQGLMQAQGRSAGSAASHGLHRRLFDAWRPDPALSSSESERYQHANRYAALYCQRLTRRFPGAQRRGLRQELRRFYRLPQKRKIRHITDT